MKEKILRRALSFQRTAHLEEYLQEGTNKERRACNLNRTLEDVYFYFPFAKEEILCLPKFCQYNSLRMINLAKEK